MRARRRGLLFLLVAAASALFSASLVAKKAGQVSAQVGPLQKVYIAKREIPKDSILTAANAERYLETRLVARRFLPQQYFNRPEQVLGLTSLVRIAAGTYLSPGQLGSGRHGPAPEVAKGQRAVDVTVPGSRALTEMVGVGSRVDVVVSSEPENRSARSTLAYQDIEVLAVAPAGISSQSSGSEAEGEELVVTLRVSVRQAVSLIAAENFAKQVALLPRPGGDRGHIRAGIAASGG